MTRPWFDVVSENNAYERMSRQENLNSRYKQSATPEVAANAASIYRQSPWLTPSQVLALAKGNASPQAVELASNLQGKVMPQKLAETKERGFFDRNVKEKFKALSRWTFATLDVGPELVQNVLSQLDKENPQGFDGWFASTKLGTMLSAQQGALDPETGLPLSAGSGFFVGETVESEQERRAREVRGSINGSGWTLGRGAASSVFRPGTKPYSIASGLIDAVILVGADPTVIGGKVSSTVKAARAGIQGVKSADELNALRKVFRGEAGFLDDAERAVVEGSKFLRFWDRHRDASRLVDRLADPELNDPVEILRDVFKSNMDLKTAGRFADATNRDEVLDILLDVTNRLDEANPNLLVTDIRDIPGARFSYDRVPLWNTVRHSRAFTQMPEQLITYGTEEQNAKAVVNLANLLDTVRGGFTKTDEGRAIMRQVFDAFADGSKAALDKADEAYDGVVNTLVKNVYTEKAYDKALERARKLNPGATDAELDVFARTAISKEIAEADEVVQALKEGLQKAKDETRAYFVGKEGKAVDNGFVQALLDLFPELREQFADLSPEQLKELKLMGPTAVVELLDRVKILPDIRKIRRLTSNPFMRRVLTSKDKDRRVGFAVAEYVQQEIWKPLTLMTGGYVARNMLDAQVRIATVGLSGAFNHPWAWIQWAMFRKAPGDITGKNFEAIMKQAMDGARDAAKDPDQFYEAMIFSLRKNLEDPTNAIYGQRTGSYKVVSRTDNRDEWFNGLVEELEQISKDTMFNASAKGIKAEDMLNYLRNDENGQKVLEVFSKYLQNGFDVVDDAGYARKISLKDVDDDVLRLWISRLIEPRVKLKTASDDQISVAVGYRRVPIGRSRIVAVDEIANSPRVKEGPEKVGRGYQFTTVDDEGRKAVNVVLKTIDEPTSGKQFVEVQQLSANDWIDTVEGRAEFRDFLEQRVKQIELDVKTKNFLPKWTKLSEKTADAREQNEFTKAANKITDGFFVGFYGMLTQKFERSPVFRQFYYEQVSQNADLLSREAGRELIEQIIRKAKEFEVSPAAYVGGRSNWAKIQKTALNATGDGGVDQLDEFAKIVALNRTKETLYNASTRNNLEDVMRIIIPFGVAHREVLSTYMKFVIQDPTRIRRAQLAYKGFENFDPDADGQGFFYKDPTTGESTFNFPLSGEISKLLTGVEAPLAAPVKRLSLGLQVIPGLGPVAQIASSNLIPDVPETDGIVSLLLPYGRRSFNVMPAWSVKLKEALQADPTKLETTYANTYVDTLRALVASGEYDTSDPQQEANLYEEARKKARWLAMMRAVAQFTGPAAPSNEFIVSTKNEDMYASAMVQELYRFQNENYDTAVQRFIETFGNDAFIYLSSKSQSVAGGLEASEQFGDWERKNNDLLRQYPEVAAYFAPSGDDFSFEVWSRQFRTGRRRRLTDKEVLDQAQYRMGSAIYRSYKDQVGAYPSEEQREWLAGVRREIHKRYKGFPEKAVFEVGKFDDEVAKLRLLVNDSRLEGNEIRNSVATYLNYRDQAISRYVSSGGKPGGFDTAKAAQPLRDYLVSIGLTLMQQNPDFGRVWERVLSSEVDR